MQQDFDSFRAFDYENSNVYLWVFKRSTTAKKFNAFHVPTDQQLNGLLIGFVKKEVARITEFGNYTYLAETNENSCLAVELTGNDFCKLQAVVDRPEPDYLVRSIKDLKNAEGYVVKFVKDNKTIYAVKRSTSNWKTSYAKNFINMVFNNGELTAAEDNSFAIERGFDFYVHGQNIFIASKRAFESAMEHRASFAQAFVTLQASPEFSQLFTDMQPLQGYVGNNSIQLRRMARIEERGLYKRAGFLSAVKKVSDLRGWGLNFETGTEQIIPCENTVKTILQVLLDHRLLSEVTDLIYDVPDATEV
jgi:hypothetical protein